MCLTHQECAVGRPQGGSLAATRGGAHQGTQAAFQPLPVPLLTLPFVPFRPSLAKQV